MEDGNGKIESLRKREAALKAAIAAETQKQQKREAKNRQRLADLIGTALVDQAGSSPDLQLMLKQILSGAVTDVSARRFLEERGWL
jgi:hypothetical protein